MRFCVYKEARDSMREMKRDEINYSLNFLFYMANIATYEDDIRIVEGSLMIVRAYIIENISI